MLDIRKISASPKNEYEAIDAMVKAQQHLLSAIHIMQSVIDNPSEEYRDYHEQNIRRFLNQFEQTKTIQQ